MKRSALAALAALLAFGTVGCAHRISGHSPGYAAARRAPTFALAVTVHGGLQPTAGQWAAIQAKIAEELSWRGAVLVTDISLADKIIRIDFRPDPIDPENAGHLVILGVRTNPYAGIARTTPSIGFAPGFSFANAYYRNGWWGSSNFYSGDYFNYIGPWENGYTSGSTSVVTLPKIVTPKPPHRHVPGSHRDLCPPDALPRTGPAYASSGSSGSLTSGTTMSPAYTSPSPTRARWTGERSAWRSDASTDRPERTYTRSDATSRSGRTWSRAASDNSNWRSSRDSSYSSYDRGSSSSGSLSAGSSHVTPTYTSPSPSYSSSDSSGSLSTSSYSSSSSSSSVSSSAPSDSSSSNDVQR